MRSLIPMFLLLSTLLPMPSQAHEALPALALRVSHESLDVTHDGVERRQRFTERFVREGDNVWLERVLPETSRHAHETHAAPGHEKEIEVKAVPRWITRAGNGAAQLALVAADRKTLYEVPASSFEALGFSGRWATSVCLLDPAAVAAMPLAARTSPVRGARWHEKNDGRTYVRVLWDEAHAFPRVIESGSVDGQQRARSVITELPMPPERPWQAARDYTRRDYSDLGD